jgi:hypothetical protein
MVIYHSMIFFYVCNTKYISDSVLLHFRFGSTSNKRIELLPFLAQIFVQHVVPLNLGCVPVVVGLCV